MISVVLSRRNWRETDQIISLYTFEQGKVEVLARGAKKLLSKNSAYLEPGCLVEAEIIPGKDLFHLGSVQILDQYAAWRQDFRRGFLGQWSFKMVNDFVQPGEKDKRIFKLLFTWLEFLNKTEKMPLLLMADCFIVKFFKTLGFDIIFSEKIDSVIKKDLEFLAKSDWSEINKIKFEKNRAKNLHATIYQFALYHSEKKIMDWAKLAYFSQE